VLTTAVDYDTYAIAIPQHADLPGGGGTASFVAITAAANGRGAQNYMTSETDYGNARTAYWQGADFNATARLTSGLTVQAGTSTGRSVRNNCEVTAALPELLGTARVDSCDITEKWATSFRGLASYTVPKIDVLVSGTLRSDQGAALNANWNAPVALVTAALGRPANVTGTTVPIALVAPGQVWGDRVNALDLRFAKILTFGRMRYNIGVDIINLTNSNAILTYNQNFNPAVTTGSQAWLAPTSVLTPRFFKLGAQIDF